MSDICNVDVMRKAFVFYYKSCRQKKKKNKAARKQPVKSDGMYLYVYFIFHILNIYTGYKFNKYIVLQFGPVKIKVPNKLLQIS